MGQTDLLASVVWFRPTHPVITMCCPLCALPVTPKIEPTPSVLSLSKVFSRCQRHDVNRVTFETQLN